jgi:hypothetical protein
MEYDMINDLLAELSKPAQNTCDICEKPIKGGGFFFPRGFMGIASIHVCTDDNCLDVCLKKIGVKQND